MGHVDKIENSIYWLKRYLEDLESELEDLKAADEKWNKQKLELKSEICLLQEEYSKAVHKLTNSPHKIYPFAANPIKIETGVERCPKCKCEFEFRMAFFQSDESHVKIGSFLYCERCKQYYKIGIRQVVNLIAKPNNQMLSDGGYAYVKCKNPHCNLPAEYNGFCFLCWKHENYEAK